MPVKWTADKDQLLLLKILETHDIKLDTNKIAAAWPADVSERPTGRAITERLVKIRQIVGVGKGMSIAASKTTSTPKKTPATPRKQKSPAIPGDSATPVSNKRKRNGIKAEPTSDDDSDFHVGRVPFSEVAALGVGNNDVDGANDEEDSPFFRGRSRRVSARPVRYQDPDGDDDDDEDEDAENEEAETTKEDGDAEIAGAGAELDNETCDGAEAAVIKMEVTA